MSVICVTGASAGIGFAIAEHFLEAGWKVVAMARRGERLDALAKKYPGKVHASLADVRDKEAVAQAFAEIPKEFLPIDVLVNNAGLALGLSPSHEASLDDWEVMVDTNIKGLLYTTKAVISHMVERGQGHIVNMGSIAGKYSYPGSNVYGSTKAFVNMFSNNLRTDLHGTGLRVTNISPGMLESEFSDVRFKQDGEKAKAVYAGADPLLPEHVAEAVFWATTQPACVDITEIEIMPTSQSLGPLQVHRK